MKEKKLREDLFEEICSLPVIDTHEHLPWDEAANLAVKSDPLSLYLTHYMSSDLISAGLSRDDFGKVVDTERDILERWKIVEPFWEFCRYTGYGRALDIAVKGIYGVEGINGKTIERLSELFARNRKAGHTTRVLAELCNIKMCLVDVWTFRPKKENGLFKYIWQPMNFIFPQADFFDYLEKKRSVKIRDIDGWLEALEAELDEVITENGVRVLKCAAAYMRTLYFEKVGYGEAKNLFAAAAAALDAPGEDKTVCFPKKLQDFMMHSVLALAGKRGVTVQFHTGLLEGNGNTLTNSDPALLTNLFLEYPDVDFDLFHIGYPYQSAVCALGKMFPNVFVDMCWAHVISPSACVSALDDFLDAIPYNKISGFGGDYLFADGVYGHLYMSRQNISRTLASRVKRNIISRKKAIDIARALYYDNPMRIFKLQENTLLREKSELS